MKTAISIFFFAISFLASAQTPKPVKMSEFLKDKQQPTVSEIFEVFVHYRDSLGLSGLVLDSNLCKAAQLQADWVAATGDFVHVQDRAALPGIPMLVRPWDRGNYVGADVSAENLHNGWKFLPASLIVESWFTSKDHRKQMLRNPPAGESLRVGIAIKNYAANPNNLVVALVFGPSSY